METLAVVLQKPEHLVLDRLELSPPGAEDVVVDVAWSGVSTGTERLLWSGDMPAFPGMGYPLVPGYESVGWVTEAGSRSGARVGEFVFVPGARCFGDVRGLFGGAAARLVVAGERVIALDAGLGERGVLMALAATAHHAIVDGIPDLVVGHGVLGRLVARLALILGATAPTVWERSPLRSQGGEGYAVVNPDDDPRQDYARICDVSGDHSLLDSLIGRLAPGGEITLAGFYSQPLSFAFPPAFIREARIRVAAEWRDGDLAAVSDLVRSGRLSLEGLITHREAAAQAEPAYRTAFNDSSCLKMVLDWRHCQ
ncbi:chlorophyll synthesis pathway protein BchC [Pelagibius sp.]|uniref:chlorophyll synthesis pathway protein BchC n=1 Tax=Pelagibius sp. TaxID=1931238 RepID=UPI003B511781